MLNLIVRIRLHMQQEGIRSLCCAYLYPLYSDTCVVSVPGGGGIRSLRCACATQISQIYVGFHWLILISLMELISQIYFISW